MHFLGNRAYFSLYGISSSLPCARQLCKVYSANLGTVSSTMVICWHAKMPHAA